MSPATRPTNHEDETSRKSDRRRDRKSRERGSFFSRLARDPKREALALYEAAHNPYLPRIVILGILVGIVGGLGAVAFHYMILGFKYVFFRATSTETFLQSVTALPWYYRVLAPALGGLIVGPVVTYVVQEARGHGVPEVMEAVVLRRAKVDFRVAPLKALVSSICIGSGGAAGREGPIVQIGAAFGSSLARFLELPTVQVRTLLAAGAAAGIGGTFNAPLAGVIFAIEVLVRKFDFRDMAPVVVAAVVGTTVANALFGRVDPIFRLPVHELLNYWELVFYVGLAIFGAGIALLYMNSLYGLEHLFEKLPVPSASKAALGGLLLGLLALFYPQVQATGYPVMTQALRGELPLQLMAVLMVGKILATSLSLGSGGSGGIFAPGLFIGAMMGGTYGMIVNRLFPGITAPATSYALVGMGTVFAASTHAPLTSIVILYEMTRDPKIMVPMMVACIIASVLTSTAQSWDIYTKKLLKRGVDVERVQKRTVIDVELEVEPGSPFDGQLVRDLGLPGGVLLTDVTDGQDHWIPYGHTRLEAGMTVTAAVSIDDIQAVRILQDGCVAGPLEHQREPIWVEE